MELEILKSHVETKADANLVKEHFDKVGKDSKEEMVNLMAEIDIEGLDAKFESLTDKLNGFAGQIGEAFGQVEAVEQSFQAHVGQAVGEAVAGTKWPHSSSEDRSAKMGQDLNVTLQTLAGTAVPVRRVPSAHVLARAPGLSGCAAGPPACG